MPDNTNKIKIAQQALASHKAKLPSTANKDQVKRQIAAANDKLKQLKATHTPK